ncbi:5989_t:CDS:2, partial [Acaulospora morrowiae]
MIHDPKYTFLKRPYQYNKPLLNDYKWLGEQPTCGCWQFAYVHNDPVYKNHEVSLETFKSFMSYSPTWKFIKQTKWKYNFRDGYVKEYRDPFIYEAIKEYNPAYYYELCDKNKASRTGKMFFSLLQYLNFSRVKPLTYQEAIRVLSKNTSAGFNGLEYSGSTERKLKGEILEFIKKKYLDNRKLILSGEEPDNYCIFSMRDHLSERTDVKTSPIWVLSGSNTLAELRYYQPFYDQINSKDFFKNIWIIGKESMLKLSRYLRRREGTVGTLLINSLLNTIAGLTIMSMMRLFSLEDQLDFESKVFDPNWLGDDFVFFIQGFFDLTKFSQMMFKYFEVKLNIERTINTMDMEERKYLGYQLK